MRGDIEFSFLILILSLIATHVHVLSRNKRIRAQNPNPLPKGEGNNPVVFSVTSVAKKQSFILFPVRPVVKGFSLPGVPHTRCDGVDGSQ